MDMKQVILLLIIVIINLSKVNSAVIQRLDNFKYNTLPENTVHNECHSECASKFVKGFHELSPNQRNDKCRRNGDCTMCVDYCIFLPNVKANQQLAMCNEDMICFIGCKHACSYLKVIEYSAPLNDEEITVNLKNNFTKN